MSGDPQAYWAVMWRSPDGELFSGIWHCTPGVFRLASPGETITLVDGHVTITPEGGEAIEIRAGDVAYIPMGFGHAIRNIGDDDLEIVQTWDAGKLEEIDLNKWVQSSPRYLVTNNFAGVPETTITDLKRT